MEERVLVCALAIMQVCIQKREGKMPSKKMKLALCMHVSMCTCMHMYHVHACIHANAYMCIHAHACIHAHMHICIQARMHVSERYVFVCV